MKLQLIYAAQSCHKLNPSAALGFLKGLWRDEAIGHKAIEAFLTVAALYPNLPYLTSWQTTRDLAHEKRIALEDIATFTNWFQRFRFILCRLLVT